MEINRTYDNAGRPESALTSTGNGPRFGFDGLGRRVVKTTQVGNPAQTSQYVYDQAGRLMGDYAGSNGDPVREYVYLGDMPVAVMTNNATVLDNTSTGVSVVGAWPTIIDPPANPTGYAGTYRTHIAGTGANTFTWTPNVATGSYRVYARWAAGPDRASNAAYQVVSAAGTANVTVNQQENDGEWVLLGTFNLTQNQGHRVWLTDNANGLVVADAVKFVPANYSTIYTIDTDHLNTPRAISSSTGVVVWRWDSDPFGSTAPNQDPDGNGVAFSFPLRFPGQFFDAETGTHYNYFRDYDPQTGRYLQSDPIGLRGGINTYLYVNANPLSYIDPLGLYLPFVHRDFTMTGAIQAGLNPEQAKRLAELVVGADFQSGAQNPSNAFQHAMCMTRMSKEACQREYEKYIQDQLRKCTDIGLANGLHADQDSFSGGHEGFQPYNGLSGISPLHLLNDSSPGRYERYAVPRATAAMIKKWREQCECRR